MPAAALSFALALMSAMPAAGEARSGTAAVVPGAGSLATLTPAEAAALVRAIVPRVEALRGRKFKSEVPVRIVGDAEARVHARRQLTRHWAEAQARSEQAAYAMLGLLPPGYDLIESVLDVLEEQAGGFYDPESKTFLLLRDMPRAMAPILIAHELTHALDDQYFDIEALMERHEEDSERFAGLAAVVEGSGTVVMTRYLIEESLAGRFEEKALEEMAESDAGRAEKLRAAPPVLQRGLLSSYVLGQGFLLRGDLARMGAATLAGDIDRAFASPPESTEQVLHPEKYWDRDHYDSPRAVRLPDMRRALGKGWKRVAAGTLGELSLAAVVEAGKKDLVNDMTASPEVWSHHAVWGWGGDTWHLYERDGEKLTILATVWDTEADAREFEAALPESLQPGVRGQGNVVVVIAGAQSERHGAIAEATLTRVRPGDAR